MLNYLIYQEFKLPQPNNSFLANNVNLSTASTTPVTFDTIVPRGLPVDGNIYNCRTITFTLASSVSFDVKISVKGLIFNGTSNSETVTISSGNTTAKTLEKYYEVISINPVFTGSITISVGFGDGYTALCQLNGSKTDHMVTFASGSPNITVYGAMTTFLNQDTKISDLKEFPLSTNMTNITSSMTQPEYILYPFGFCRAYMPATSNVDVVYRVGLQNLRG